MDSCKIGVISPKRSQLMLFQNYTKKQADEGVLILYAVNDARMVTKWEKELWVTFQV